MDGWVRIAVIAALLAAVAYGCGDDGGTTVVVRTLPDTPDVEPGPLQGLWLDVGGETARTDADGKAHFSAESGRVTICERGTSETPTPADQTCIDGSLPAGGRIELRFSDLGLQLER